MSKRQLKYYFAVILILLFIVPSVFADYKQPWNILLKRYVTPGAKDHIAINLVDYKRLRKDRNWPIVLGLLANFDPNKLKTRNEKIAFWINAYNIGAVKMIADNYPLKSIRDKSSLFNSVWDQKIINIGGGEYTLGHIEHQILRKFDEPKIHFAIVCASVSCPDMRQKPYYAKRLNQQLDDQVELFLANPHKGIQIDWGYDTIYISSIFKWFEKDFKDVRKFIAKNVPKIKKIITDKKYKIEYLKYDWALNERENSG